MHHPAVQQRLHAPTHESKNSNAHKRDAYRIHKRCLLPALAPPCMHSAAAYPALPARAHIDRGWSLAGMSMNGFKPKQPDKGFRDTNYSTTQSEMTPDENSGDTHFSKPQKPQKCTRKGTPARVRHVGLTKLGKTVAQPKNNHAVAARRWRSARLTGLQIYTPKKDTTGTRAVPGAPWKVTKSVSPNASFDLNMLELGTTTQRRLSDLYQSL